MAKSQDGKRKVIPAPVVNQESETTSTPSMTVIEGGASVTPRARLEHVPPERFKALQTELGLSNKQVAAAIGRTLSRVSELTHSKGASINIYNAFETALRNYTPSAETETE